ncbi:MAG: heme ABC transporter ATP-binding protein [Bacteroidota bacterium]
MIDVKNISVRKGGRRILEDVSFNIKPGHVTVAIGRNGAGKSTLLETLTGRNKVDKGRIHWDGKMLNQMPRPELAKRRSVLSQNVQIDFPILVTELVEMGSYVASETLVRQKIDSLVRHALSQVEMTEFANRSFNTLSGGEQKRVLLAKCLVQLNCCHWADISKYLFLDEPTASLDIEQQHKLLAFIRRLVRRRNIGVFAVLHDLNLAAQFADEILMMKAGKLLVKGRPEEVLTSDILQQILGVEAIVQTHPVYACPHIIPLAEKHTLVRAS